MYSSHNHITVSHPKHTSELWEHWLACLIARPWTAPCVCFPAQLLASFKNWKPGKALVIHFYFSFLARSRDGLRNWYIQTPDTPAQISCRVSCSSIVTDSLLYYLCRFFSVPHQLLHRTFYFVIVLTFSFTWFSLLLYWTNLVIIPIFLRNQT